MEETSILIVGYGNVGRGVREAIKRNSDMGLAGIVTRSPQRVTDEIGKGVPVFSQSSIVDYETARPLADVAILCGGSKNDLPIQGPQFAKIYNTVDSFDNHDHISPYVDEETGRQMPGYFADMNNAALVFDNTSVISAGWDPGTFSLNRVLMDAFLPGSIPKGFYGLKEEGGLSMGHSDAIRGVSGVADARQYTHAIPEAIKRVRNGENPNPSPGEMHWRECQVVLKKDTPEERERVTDEIKNMENYFKPYETTVDFVTQDELHDKYSEMPHDGLVLAVGETGKGNKAILEYGNQFESNPEGTANVLVACARAAHRLNLEGTSGAKTMLDIPAAYLSSRSHAELLENFM